ncbi:APC family permease [Streptomyces sp. NPDC018031]|uniref:APC family permease n=1 Tax=Streptomyces sp. NPDC018031 TaxID=3365033 RepID=UPI0037B88ABB
MRHTEPPAGERPIEPELRDKGLRHGALGLTASVVLGISSVAPAYALTATLGPAVDEVGPQTPAVFLSGFLPMFLVAYAYRELNRSMPDCGTSFTWTVKAFGPHVGWMCGWGTVVATVIVLSNLAGVATDFLYLTLGELTGSTGVAGLSDNKAVNILTCLGFLAGATAVAYRGMTVTKEVQYVLVAMQLAVLALFTVLALVKAGDAGSEFAVRSSWSWLDPGRTRSFAAFTAGISLSLFIYWGWDTSLTVNEETSDRRRTPGRAALLTMVIILTTYLLVAVAAQRFAGVGREGYGLGSPETGDNAFAALADPVLGELAALMFFAVLASSVSSLQTTFLLAARTLLAMGFYQAVSRRFAEVHPRFRSPSFATLCAGAGTGLFYTVMTLVSRHALVDTIYALGLMICFYYGLTAYACVWYFRTELTAGARDFVFKGLFPALGATLLTAVFLKTAVDTWDPAYGSGDALFGVGTVFWIAVGLLGLGLLVMLVSRRRAPAFFRGRTLRHTHPTLDAPY